MDIYIKKEGSRIKISNYDGMDYVYYDFKDHSFYNPITLNKITVASARSRLARLRIQHVKEEDSDKNIIELIKYIKKDTDTHYYSLQSLASMIDLFKKYSNIEKLISMGVKVIDVKTNWVNRIIPFHVFKNEIPKKKVIDYFLKNDIKLNFIATLDDIEIIEYYKNEIGLDSPKALMEEPSYYDKDSLYYISISSLRKLLECIKEYKLHKPTCLKYLYNICEYEGIRLDLAMNLFSDYIRMSTMMLGSTRKVDKYPKHLRSIHDICSYNYNKRKKEYDEKIFSSRYNNIYSYTGKKYSIVEPTCTKDIVDEGVALHHCVGSYVDRIIAGKTMIVFLRESENLNKSYITVEIKGKEIVQIQGKCGKDITEEEKNFLKEYARKLNIEYAC